MIMTNGHSGAKSFLATEESVGLLVTELVANAPLFFHHVMHPLLQALVALTS